MRTLRGHPALIINRPKLDFKIIVKKNQVSGGFLCPPRSYHVFEGFPPLPCAAYRPHKIAKIAFHALSYGKWFVPVCIDLIHPVPELLISSIFRI